MSQVDDLALNVDPLRTTTLNQQEQMDLMATSTVSDQNITATENTPSLSSLQKFTIIKPSEKKQNNNESSLDV